MAAKRDSRRMFVIDLATVVCVETCFATNAQFTDARIDVSQMVKTSAIHDHVKIVIVSQSLTIMQQCSSKLGDETLDLEFQKTKRCLKQAWDRLETTLIQYNRGACIAFQ